MLPTSTSSSFSSSPLSPSSFLSFRCSHTMHDPHFPLSQSMKLLSMLLFILALLWKGSSNLEIERNAQVVEIWKKHYQEICRKLEETLADTEAPLAGVDDMAKLAYLREPGVLYNLAARFALNEIYVHAAINVKAAVIIWNLKELQGKEVWSIVG